jgi:hypothetical protein
MLGHLVVHRSAEELHHTQAGPGWLSRLLTALFKRRR